MKEIVEAVLAPLVNKLAPLIYNKIKQQIIEDLISEQDKKINEIKTKLIDLSNTLNYIDLSNQQKLAEVGSAIKGVYDLVSSIIQISTKR